MLALAGFLSACAPSDPAPRFSAQVFRTPAGVAAKPLVARPTGLAIGDELVVALRPGSDPDIVALDVGGEVIWRGPSTGAFVLRFDSVAAADAGLTELRGRGEVVEAERNRVMGGTAGGSGVGTSPGLVSLQWNLWAFGLGGLDSWGGGDGVVVAVLDSGAAYEDHADDLGAYAVAPDLAEVEFLQGRDFINDDDHANDDHGHGTHVTGVIAASAGIAPIAPGVSILPVKVLDADNLGTELALAEGIRYAADHGADVINMSLSFPPTYFPSRTLQAAVDYAAARGVVMVAAAGNHDEDVITYPAAFRDVLAVGASSLRPWYHPHGDDADRWDSAFWFVERAPYSNRGYRLDFVAPAGRIDGDVDDDGNAEAVVAQTFVEDPTEFGYYFFAGTSQAAAQVSGLAAVMLAANPDLSPADLRDTIGETAAPLSWKLLSPTTGRGRVDAAGAIDAADEPAATAPRQRYRASILLTLHEGGKGKRTARAIVEVVDASGAPAVEVSVYGTFTGAAFGGMRRITDETGTAVFKSNKFPDTGRVVAFQVDAVGTREGLVTALDRPTGFVRIDSLSLELLAAFAGALGAGGELLPTPGADAAASGAAGEVGGGGVGTSPGGPVPSLQEPIPIAIRVVLSGDLAHKLVPSLLLPNFSWGLATVPMAVVVDEDWFLAEFPDAIGRVVTSFGSGVGTSPLWFDRLLSFPAPVDLGYADEPTRIALQLTTFSAGSGVGTSPRRVLAEPTYALGIALDRALVDATLDLQWSYWWGELTGSGVGTSPIALPGVPATLHAQLGNALSRYIAFGLTDASSPAAAYGAVLEAAGLSLAPVSPASDGTGIGTSPVHGL